jgi:hypothetical protein
LNQDVLFKWGLANPGFPGSGGFLGKLSGSGSAMATLALPPDPTQMLVGYPIHLAAVMTSPGPSLPILGTTNPVHVKYVP